MPTPLRRFILAVVMAALGRFTPGCEGAILISEIMYNPQGADLDTSVTPNISREWVEIFNTGAEAVDLSGWSFGDSQDNQWASPFPTGTSLASQQALVITGDAATFDSSWGRGVNRIEVDSFPTLANTVGTNEGAAIRDNNDVLKDVVRFQESGWPTASGSDGNSIFLLPDALSTPANDVGSNWKPSSAGVYGAKWRNFGGQGENHGSPGYVATEVQSPFAPSPNAVWSMVVLPDTQNYAKNTAHAPIFTQMTTWIRDNKDLHNIELVLHEGDIVNQNSQVVPTSGNQSGDQQWANAKASMSVLDGHVPYILTVGNHDLGTTSAQNRDTQFNDFFKSYDNPLVNPAQGGILKGQYEGGKMENAYFELHAPDGRNLLIFSLEFWPRQEVVDWANSVASRPQFEDHTAVLLTHSYMNWNEQRTNANPDNYGVGGDSHDGEQLWQELVSQNGNFEMTFSGHVGGDGVGYKLSTGVEGNQVHQMLINSQFETNAGNGWLRVLEFLDDGTTVRVRTYSPFLDLYRTDPANDYLISLTPLPPVEYAAADFNRDGFVDGDDLAVWQTNFGVVGTATGQTGDADGDLDVDGADFLLWQQQVTGSAPAGASQAAVPETSSLALLASASLLALMRRRMA